MLHLQMLAISGLPRSGLGQLGQGGPGGTRCLVESYAWYQL
jgi:hypothetical protein